MGCDFLAIANAGIQGLSPYQPGKPIEELERELGIREIVKLASNENPLGPSARVIEACRQAAGSITRYPDSNGFELKKALAERHGVDMAQIALGNGSNDLLDLVGRVFLNPGASAVYSEHAFVVYPLAVQAAGATALVVPATDYGHDLPAMAAAVRDDTRVVFIANPNNPTGTWNSRAELVSLLDAVPDNVVVVLDEAYAEYVDKADYPDGIELLAHYPNLVVTRTFSKAWGLAGLRVGYSISDPAIADLLNRIRAPFNVNSLALAAARAVLDDADYLEHSLAVNRDGMAQLEAGLGGLGLEWIPSVGNFITVRMPGDSGDIYQRLLREGVIVRPIGVYGLADHLRISIGLQAENARFLEALAVVLEGVRA